MSTTANLLVDKLRTVEARYDELTQQLADPEVVSDSKRYQKTAKAHSDLGELVSKFREYKDLERGIAETKAMVREETDPAVRVVLGHFVFVYIHPYMDGNGRMGRFLMNLMMASGGYPWTIVRTTRRTKYLDALEAASTEHDIVPFAKFIREEMNFDWSKESPRKNR